MARPTCSEEGCTRPSYCRGRCVNCYQKFRRSAAFEPLPRAEYAPPGPAVCPWCGPYTQAPSQSVPICPTCGLTPGEVAYSERIIADSDAVWREENRAFQLKRGGT